MKYLYSFASIGLIFYLAVVPVSGQTVNTTPTPTRFVTPTLSPEQRDLDRERRRIEDRRQRAIIQINRSMTKLNNLINKISTNPELTEEQRRRLINNIQAENARIRSLEDDIRRANDIATIESIEDRIKEIEDNAEDLYRSVANLLEDANELLVYADELETATTRLDRAINEARARGQAVAGFDATLANMRAKIRDARNRGNATINTLLGLRPVNEAVDDAAIDNARAELRNADKMLDAAKRDGKAIVRELLKIYRDYFDL